MPAQFPIIFGIAAIVTTLVALYAWMTRPAKVLDEIDALDLDATTKAILKSCCESAKAADNKVRFYDLAAPIVMLLVLTLVKREADRRPRMFSAWDNNISLNGGGYKLEIPFKSAEGTGRAAAVAIGRSLKRRDQTDE